MTHAIMDGHVHVFPKKLQDAIYGWFQNDGWSLVLDGLGNQQLMDRLSGAGIQGGQVLVYAHKPGVAASLNRWLFEWGQSHSQYRLYGTVHPGDADFDQEIWRGIDQYRFQGFKIHANVQRIRVDDPVWFPLYDAVLETGKTLVLHVGREPHRNEFVGLESLAAVMRRYPDLPIQVAHLGYDELDTMDRLLDRYASLYVDTAGIPSRRLPLPLDKLRAFILRWPDRVIYGSDVPIVEDPIETHQTLLREAIQDSRIERKVFSENLRKFWGDC